MTSKIARWRAAGIPNLGKAMGANLALPVASIATGPILARALGVEDRGVLAIYVSSLTLAAYVLAFGSQDTQASFAARGMEDSARLSRWRLFLFVGSAAPCWLAVSFLVVFTSNPSVLSILLLSALPVVVWQLGLRGLMQGRHLFGLLLLERWLGVAGRLIALVVLVSFGLLNVNTAYLAQIVSMTVPLILVYLIARPRALQLNERSSSSEYLRYSANIWTGGLVMAVLLRADQLLMVPFSSTYELGLYVVGVTVAEVLIVVSGSVKAALIPSAVSMQPAELSGLLIKTMALGSVVVVITAPVAYFLIPLIFGEAFEGSRWPAVILIVGFVPVLLLDFVDGVLQARGVGSGRLRASALAAAATLCLLPFAVSFAGAVGAAFVSVVAYMLAAGSMLLLARRRLGIRLRNSTDAKVDILTGRF